VCLDELGDDREPDAAPAHAVRALPAPEALEDVWELGRRNAGTRVLDDEESITLRLVHVECHPASRRRELERIPEQVVDDLTQARRIADDLRRCEALLECQLGSLEVRAQPLGGLGGDRPEIHALRLEIEPGGLGGGQRLEVADQPAESQHLIVQRGELLARGWHDAVDDCLARGLQDGHGRAQLMGDVGDERAAKRALALDRLGRQREILRLQHDPTALSRDRVVLGRIRHVTLHALAARFGIVDDDQRVGGQIVEDRLDGGLEQGREGLRAGRNVAAQQRIEQLVDGGQWDPSDSDEGRELYEGRNELLATLRAPIDDSPDSFIEFQVAIDAGECSELAVAVLDQAVKALVQSHLAPGEVVDMGGAGAPTGLPRLDPRVAETLAASPAFLDLNPQSSGWDTVLLLRQRAREVGLIASERAQLANLEGSACFESVFATSLVNDVYRVVAEIP